MGKANKSILFPVMLFLVPVLFMFQSCLEEPKHEETPPQIDEFTIMPAAPVSKDEVNMITYDCKYYMLASVQSKSREITVKKRFNSQMKWPCVLFRDTIPLGRLNQGNYTIILLIIDTNPLVKDSIYVQQTLTLDVGK